MIFNLPPILGFLPLIVYMILSLRGVDLLLTACISVALGAVLTGQSLVSFGNVMYASLGSFLALVGLIIMMGAGLGEVLKKTKVAHNIVYLSITKMHLKTPRQGLCATMVICTILVAMLGTLAGSNAIIASIVIPILASMGVVPGALAIAMQGGATCGLIMGPFTPNTLTVMGLTGLSYPEYLLKVSLPLSVIIWIVSYVMANRLQERGKGTEAFGSEDLADIDEFVPNADIMRGTAVFLLTMALLIINGILSKAGAAYAIVVMILVALTTGIAAKMSFTDILKTFVEGGAKLYWLFFMFLLYNPFLDFVAQAGAFDAVVTYMRPLVDAGGNVAFTLLAALIGIFGISGAGVAQAKIIHELFFSTVTAIGLPIGLWGFVILIGSVLTCFVMPNPDNIGTLGLAHSNNLKGMLVNGWVAMAVSLIVLFVRTVILI